MADPQAPPQVVELAEQRARARGAKDWSAADALRDRIDAAGWTVTDTPGGYTLEPSTVVDVAQAEPLDPGDVVSVLDRPATADVSVEWVVEGWPEDVERALEAFRAHAGSREMHYVVVDVAGQDPSRWGPDVEVVSLRQGTGWAAARNAGLRRSRGRTVLVLDGSIEPSGDVLAPLEAVLKDEGIGVCGPFGIVTKDLRQFQEAPEPGPCDAVEGYLMAFRRELLADAGMFDEKFRWYRTADIDWSFRVKDAGYRCEVVSVPVTKHPHRMWFETPPDERAKWSKRNFYRFLDRFRDRWDLVLAGKPQQRDPEEHDEGLTLPEGR